jgi:hypothetical protein
MNWKQWLLLTVNITGMVIQNLTIPLWASALPAKSCVDPYVIFLITVMWYPVVFGCILAVYTLVVARKSLWDIVVRFSWHRKSVF